jgi:heme/copper-type cytochrome/quinol oxidase subunit 3
MSDFNMKGEKYPPNFDGDLSKVNEEKKESKFGFLDFILTMIFLFSFFGFVYLYFQNQSMEIELKQKHLLIMDLEKKK